MTKAIPSWASQPFTDFLNYSEQLHKILHVSMHGISLLRGVPNLIEALRGTSESGEDGDYGEDRLDSARQEATFAQSEIDNGFPILHAQITIALWTALESLVRTFLVAWLTNVDDAKSCDELKKVRVKLGEYESLVGDDRNFYLLDLLEDSMGTRRSPGIGRFEALFNAFGLSSQITDDITRPLFELYHIRNVLVHRRAIADRKIVANCPWLNLTIGQPIVVTHQAFIGYSRAVSGYVLELIQRTRTHFGIKRYEDPTSNIPTKTPPNESTA